MKFGTQVKIMSSFNLEDGCHFGLTGYVVDVSEYGSMAKVVVPEYPNAQYWWDVSVLQPTGKTLQGQAQPPSPPKPSVADEWSLAFSIFGKVGKDEFDIFTKLMRELKELRQEAQKSAEPPPTFYGLLPNEVALIKQGKKINAIKTYRDRTNAGLANAKDIIEAFEKLLAKDAFKPKEPVPDWMIQ